MGKRKRHPYRWFIWLIAVTFYFYEYVLRVSPSILVPQLMDTFKVDAGTVGIISAFYFYAYAPMQLPVGIMTDRFGARRLLTFAALVVGIGGVMFSLAHTIVIAEIGRLLLGFGSAFAFIGTLYIITHWFEKSKWSLLIGIANSIGMMGAVIGEGPMSHMVNRWGFRPTMFIISLISFGICVLILLVVRNQPKEFHAEEESWKPSFWLSLKTVFKSKPVWVVSLVSMGYFMGVIVFGSLWGVPFLMTSNGFSQEVASFGCSMIYFGFVIGGPIIGHVADKIGRKKHIMSFFLFLTTILVSALIYLSPMSEGVVFLLIFAVGFCSSGQLLSFSLAIESSSNYLKGTAGACINGIAYVGGAIFQPLVGSILDSRSGGTGKYVLLDFQYSFSLIVILLICAFVGSFFVFDPKKKAAKAKLKLQERMLKSAKDMAAKKSQASKKAA